MPKLAAKVAAVAPVAAVADAVAANVAGAVAASVAAAAALLALLRYSLLPCWYCRRYGVDSFLTLKRLEDAEWEESRAELQTGMLHTGVVHGA